MKILSEEEKRLEEMKKAERPVYKGGYDQQLNDIYEQIKNRKPFEFRLNGNALYDDIQDRAKQNGKLAMRDTMGRAAALTGGYGSSFSQRVGQQTYDANLRESMDVIPELYQMALRRYEGEGQGLKDQYAMAGDLANKEYGQYRDQLKDYEYRQELQRQQEQQKYERDRYEQERAESIRQNAYSNLYAIIKSSGYSPSDEELQAAGMSRGQADALRQAYIQATTPRQVSGGGSRGGGGGSRGGGNSGNGNDTNKEEAPKGLSDVEYRGVIQTLHHGGYNQVYNSDVLDRANEQQYNDIKAKLEEMARRRR